MGARAFLREHPNTRRAHEITCVFGAAGSAGRGTFAADCLKVALPHKFEAHFLRHGRGDVQIGGNLFDAQNAFVPDATDDLREHGRQLASQLAIRKAMAPVETAITSRSDALRSVHAQLRVSWRMAETVAAQGMNSIVVSRKERPDATETD